METKYYDGTKLLSMLDINGEKPEIYMCTANRTAGKTTFFSRMFVNRFLKYGEKFALLYRFNYELDSVEDKFFKDIQSLFFTNYSMISKNIGKGIIKELYLVDERNDDETLCGYAISMNSADQIKKYSHFFSDVQRILFDEFQSETNKYCANELQKFLSIHTSIARGHGEQVRYVPVYMVSNPVSLINPYYTEMGISTRLRTETKFLKGNGFVLEQGYNETASEAQKQSGVAKAFAGNKYVAYSSESVYLNDNYAFIERPKGKAYYVCTLIYQGENYGVKEYADSGIIYCDNKADITHKFRISVTTEDHQINYVMLRKNDAFIQQLRYFFERGVFRFADLKCKEALLSALTY